MEIPINLQKCETLYQDGDAYFSDLLLAIGSAKKSIKLETYIFTYDRLGQRILHALGEAVKRQVPVSLKTDGVGSFFWLAQLAAETARLKIKFMVYHPLPSLLKPTSIAIRWGKLNKRNHRKMCIIDSSIAFVTSMNVDDCHLREFSGDKVWRDTGVRLEGSQLPTLEKAFDNSMDDPYRPDDLVKINNSYFKRRKYYLEIKKRIALAKNRIWITSPYFNPPPILIWDLCRAAKRGVDVRLLLGNKQDQFLLFWVYTYHYSYLMKHGVRIYEYGPSILHAKVKILDNWITIGSSNQNYRSYFHDLEVDIVLTQNDSNKNMEQQFLKDIELSLELNLVQWKKRSFIHAVIEKFLSLFRAWI